MVPSSDNKPEHYENEVHLTHPLYAYLFSSDFLLHRKHDICDTILRSQGELFMYCWLQMTESLDFAGPTVKIDAMNEIHDVKASDLVKQFSVVAGNVESEDDLVSQHAKVAEEAIAGAPLQIYFDQLLFLCLEGLANISVVPWMQAGKKLKSK